VFNIISDPYVIRFLPQIKNSFVEGLNQYCSKVGCKKPSEDLLKPLSTVVDISKSDRSGQAGDVPFEWYIAKPAAALKMVTVYFGSYIYCIQATVGDSVTKWLSDEYGNKNSAYGKDW
jgi:hypothetical protein